jgi:uncharacterized protein YbjT (DUF2867 family)
MADKKIIAVVGATGAQGGGLVRAISRIATAVGARDHAQRDSLKAQDRRSARRSSPRCHDEANRRGAAGRTRSYFVTNFWEHFTPEKELTQAGNMARAAKAAGIKHAIWSTLEDTRNWVPLNDNRMPTLLGEYKVPHYDAKGAANRLFTDAGVPTTFLLTSFYWDNFIYFGMEPKKGPDGKLAITLPTGEAKLPGIAAEDIGKCAYGIFRKGAETIGKTIGIAGDHLTGTQMAAAMSEALGQPVVYNSVTPEAFRGFGFPGAEDLGNMFQFKRDFESYYCGARSLDVARSLNPELQDFRTWLARNASKMPIK